VRYIIIGNGVAGTSAAAHIRQIDSNGQITILSEEAYPFYTKIRLPEFLSGEVDEQKLIIRKSEWYRELKIELLLDTGVSGIDIDKKTVLTAGGNMAYDRLLLATGGISFVPPIPGADRKGVFTLRTLADAIAIRAFAQPANKRVLLIGGGVLGLEAGNGLRKAGHTITVAEVFPRLLPRQMDHNGASILQSRMEQLGFQFYLGAQSKEIIGNDAAEGLILNDGTCITCDMVIISAGVRPNAVLAKALGLKIEKGVIVNDRMSTGIPDVYAAGDLIQHNAVFYGLWPAAEKQGAIAGINMAGGDAVYHGTTISNRLKVIGINLVAAGDIDADGKKKSIVLKDRDSFIYKKLVLDQNSITGTILYGDITDSRKILNAIKNRTDISGMKKDLEQWNMEKL
jgi:nitrite reductase (NADH) large subunit